MSYGYYLKGVLFTHLNVVYFTEGVKVVFKKSYLQT